MSQNAATMSIQSGCAGRCAMHRSIPTTISGNWLWSSVQIRMIPA